MNTDKDYGNCILIEVSLSFFALAWCCMEIVCMSTQHSGRWCKQRRQAWPLSERGAVVELRDIWIMQLIMMWACLNNSQVKSLLQRALRNELHLNSALTEKPCTYLWERWHGYKSIQLLYICPAFNPWLFRVSCLWLLIKVYWKV